MLNLYESDWTKKKYKIWNTDKDLKIKKSKAGARGIIKKKKNSRLIRLRFFKTQTLFLKFTYKNCRQMQAQFFNLGTRPHYVI